MSGSASSLAISILVCATLCSGARSQCSNVWSSAAPEASLVGIGTCSTLWDPDGVGSEPERLVIGGSGLIGGSAPAGQRVMTWNGSQWQALGSGPGTTGQVLLLTTWNGLLVAGGTFTGGGTDNIALWDGTAWLPLGPGLPFSPVALTQWNGNLVATGNSPSPVVSAWNGTAWSNLPAPPQLTLARDAASFQGLLCVAGSTGIGGRIERWNGTAWLPSIAATGPIFCLAVRAFQFNSTLFAAGGFMQIGSTVATRIASTTGGTTFSWSTVGSGLPDTCIALHARSTSALGTTLVARISGTSTPMMQSTGSNFTPMGAGTLYGMSFYAGSYHATTFGSSAAPCVRYDGSNWIPVVGQSIDGEVRALTRSGADLIVGGTIQATAGTALNRIARWNGSAFQPLGTGIGGTSVDALATLGNGDIVAGGLFLVAGGGSVANIARWNGSAWSGLGTGCDQQVLALCRMPNGDVVAGGRFATAGGVACARIARWNGTAWSPLGTGMNGDVLALAVRSDGTLFAAGAFTIAGNVGCSRIARWNGTIWSPVGPGANGDVHALAVRPNDDVVAVGAFTALGALSADRCARWNGTTWAAMGASSGDAGPARAVLALPNGDVVAGRGFHEPATSPDSGFSRWNGSTWSGFGSGLAAATPGNSVAVRTFAQQADGVLVVGGNFTIVDGLAAHGLARLSPTCPALTTSYGAGCSSTAGPLVLAAETLPWTGATFRTATTGIAPVSLCIGVTGFAPVSLPLPSLLPAGQAGCTLLASPDILEVIVPDGTGTARSALALAADPALLGAVFYQQAIPIEFSAAMALVAVRGSNALAATIGML